MFTYLHRLMLSVVLLAGITSTSYAQKITSTIHVDGACGMCKTRIERIAKDKGATAANWNLTTHVLTIQHPANVSKDDIEKALSAAGHDTENYNAPDEVYNELPECCLYRANGHPDEGSTAIYGIVLSEDNRGTLSPLAGANIVWLRSGIGVSSDENGFFSINPVDDEDQLIISFAGYTPDTLKIQSMNDIQIILGTNNMLSAVQVSSKGRGTFVNKFNPVRVQTITSKELMKAACCNLSESFETNPSVDVNYTDAVTGSKQIQLLGLAGVYAQLTVENMPGPRGLATATGLSYIPGTWIESIQLSKGTGSVVNGYESIAGQINIELKKPMNSEHLLANVYVNNQGKVDVNLNVAAHVGEKWSTGILLHNASFYNKMDVNKDGFRDQPNGNLFAFMNRWNYQDPTKGIEGQIGIKYLTDRKTGGELDYKQKDKFSDDVYGVIINNDRYEMFGKIGHIFSNSKYKSIGLQVSGIEHEQEAVFGKLHYKARQTNLYANLIYQSIIGNSKHIFKTGASVNSDRYDELFALQNYDRTETTSGAFFEYAFTPNDQFTLVAGLRGDYNNYYGWAATPRLNIRYAPTESTTIRVSGGRGMRTANIFAENMPLFASSRTIVIDGNNNKHPYGLDREVAWNKGITIDQQFKMFGRVANIAVDYFRNDFDKQVVVDVENPRELRFYNLNGKSYSNSIQTELNFIPVKSLDVRMAYRFFDVKTNYSGSMLSKPLTARHRAFLNMGYEWKGWRFDYTLNYIGEKRIPSTKENPVAYQMRATSPDYFTMNAQITKVLSRKYGWEVYVGGENLTNYYQKHAILANDAPFSPYFDASLIWGPLQERMFYFGMRFKINDN